MRWGFACANAGIASPPAAAVTPSAAPPASRSRRLIPLALNCGSGQQLQVANSRCRIDFRIVSSRFDAGSDGRSLRDTFLPRAMQGQGANLTRERVDGSARAWPIEPKKNADDMP